MQLPNTQFCPLPWISLEATPVGTVRPCCLAQEELRDAAGVKFDLNHAGLAEIQHSPDLTKLRQQFLRGEQPTTCERCWREEAAGRHSKRLHTIDRLQHLSGLDTWTDRAKPLRFLDLKLGNICNLKCRICGSWSSSQIATEEIQESTSPKETYAYHMLRAGAWPRNNDHFWQEIDGVVDHINYIEFTGGEPFLIREHFELLQRLVDRGLARNIELHYNTNGTQYPVEAEAVWANFRLVEIAISIDDLNERFEYQRTNAEWARVVANLERFRQLRARAGNIELQACSTVNIFNVYYLEELANWLDLQQFDYIYWNIMHSPDHFSIGSLPKKIKDQVATRLAAASVSPRHQSEFAGIVDYMMKGKELELNEIKIELLRLDNRRKTNLKTVALPWAEILDYDSKMYGS